MAAGRFRGGPAGGLPESLGPVRSTHGRGAGLVTGPFPVSLLPNRT